MINGLTENYVDDTDSILDEMFNDDSGFDESSMFGVDKVDRPSEYGLKASMNAANKFASAGDSQDVDLIFDKAFPNGDGSGFDNDGIPAEDIHVDINTIPAVPSESDQFVDPDDEEDAENADVSDNELADDEDIEEAFTGYDDLF